MEDFDEKPLKFQIDTLRLVERDLLLRSSLVSQGNQFRQPIVGAGSKTVKSITWRAIAIARKRCVQGSAPEDTEAVQKRIKELERELEAEQEMEKLDVACENLVKVAKEFQTVSAGTQDGSNRKKRKANFDEIAKHAQVVLDLHKKLKRDESPSEETDET